jgi:hypothetical protein
MATIPDGGRIPAFGDYAIATPNLPNLDMRKLKPSATIRYTVDDAWIIAKGANVRDRGFGQYRQYCGLVAANSTYLGAAFSPGSDYIEKCHGGTQKLSRLSTDCKTSKVT